ncbi:MAG: hypothetical protein K5675_11015 [Lachnospiraceae bacterium]|nr:hypothetical protein [Lachnospiraceae bacterium]
MNKIDKELQLSKKYYLEMVEQDENLVKLTQDNVARVEAMIHFNSSYSGKFVEYCRKFAKVITENEKISPDEYKDLIEKLVISIDSENSTHLNSDGGGRVEITNRLINIRKKDLLRYLQFPAETNYKLLRIIEEETIPKGESEKGNKRKGRTNTSFASKFCHYTAFYLFEGKKEQDNYSIYDRILRKTIPKYAKHYGIKIKVKDLKDYCYYQQVVDEIIKKSESNISRNGFDHLIWYCYK